MYTVLILVLLALAALLIYSGVKKRITVRMVTGCLLLVFTYFFFWFMGFYGEILWFQSLGYDHRFLKEIFSKIEFAFAGAVLGWLFTFILTLNIPGKKKWGRFTIRAGGTIIGGLFGLSNWEIILKFFNRITTQIQDPVLGKSTSFYLFSLPFYDMMYNFLLIITLWTFIFSLALIYTTFREGQLQVEQPETDSSSTAGLFKSLFISMGILIIILAAGKYLQRFHLLYSNWGTVNGPGWTDVHIRLPAYIITVVITAALGIVILFKPLRRSILLSGKKRSSGNYSPSRFIVTGAVILIGTWFVILSIIPGLLQWLRVEPNEITLEKPYIEHNIEFTRRAFNLHKVEEKQFPASAEFTRSLIQRNQDLFSNVRLWDYRALDAVYKQFQEIRLYYEFEDVDIDRYHINDTYRQMMVSAREMDITNLPEKSKTFVNKRFKYTHGNGITLTNVSEFTPQGLPNLLVKDIPPKSTYPQLNVEVPQIYYGELTREHVVVNTKEKEFDYPSGDENVFIRYSGKGGVEISSLWRKFLFGWKFGGTRLFLTGYPTEESRIQFHRQIQERVQILAPFLKFDDDPYIVLSEGKLYWIIDAYTTTKKYPYSEPYSWRYFEGQHIPSEPTELNESLEGINYIRNSVKVVVDAFQGSVDFYIYEPNDPLIQVWDRIFPDLFKSREEMPAHLVQHVRYPLDKLLIQGLMYAKYHMTDPTVFYNQEDLWVRATEKYYNQIQPVEPYYVMWELPESDEAEFVLILPFTPKNRQVLIGWIAGMCDGENYGRFLAYQFPKEKRILGPQQVETKIDQDRFLSGQLTLWDQRGSNVLRGNVLAIPIEKTLIYVEPIYLQAETAAYPELRLVAVMHNDQLSYAETFSEALEGLFGEKAAAAKAGISPAEKTMSVNQWIQQAYEAYNTYLQALGNKEYQRAADAMKKLQEALEQLSQQTSTESQ